MLEWSASAMASALMTDDRHNHAAAREEEDGKSVLSRSLQGVPASVGPYLTSSTLSDGLVSDFVGVHGGPIQEHRLRSLCRLLSRIQCHTQRSLPSAMRLTTHSNHTRAEGAWSGLMKRIEVAMAAMRGLGMRRTSLQGQYVFV